MNFIFDTNFAPFLSRVKKYTKFIMSSEMKLNVHRTKFEYGGMLIPFSVVIFEDDKKLGFYDHHSYQIAINKKLMYQAKDEVLKDILRHELAHMFVCLNSPNASAHGSEFKEVCKSFGWDEKVSKAYASVSELNLKEDDIHHDRLNSKLKKLFALAESGNEHEASLALKKANDLIEAHQLNYISQNEIESAYLKRTLYSKRLNSKMKAIYEILKLFYVCPVFNYGKEGVYLEIIGNKQSVEYAHYVSDFLDQHLEHLWKELKKTRSELKGISAKNAFFQGVAQGYSQKINESKQTDKNSTALITSALTKQTELVYSRLSHRSSQKSEHKLSQNLGQKAGKSLNINKPIKGFAKKLFLK